MIFITLTQPLVPTVNSSHKSAPVYINIDSIRLIVPNGAAGSQVNIGTAANLVVLETPAEVFSRIESATANIMLDGAHPSDIEF